MNGGMTNGLPGGGSLEGTDSDEADRTFWGGLSPGAKALEQLCPSSQMLAGQMPPAAVTPGTGPLPLLGSQSGGS